MGKRKQGGLTAAAHAATMLTQDGVKHRNWEGGAPRTVFQLVKKGDSTEEVKLEVKPYRGSTKDCT